MTHAMTRRAAASLLALGPALLGAARPTRAAEPAKDPPVFRIGALLGLTDKANWNATVMQRGILMAVEEINAKGGIDGIKVEAAIEDHQGVPRVGVDALQRLRARYDIQAVCCRTRRSRSPLHRSARRTRPSCWTVARCTIRWWANSAICSTTARSPAYCQAPR